MKGCRFKFAISLVVVIVCGIIMPTNAGDLNPPPGAIAPTNCTQLNAQAITLPFTITTSGCYVLTSNLTGVASQNGIIISADNVTLDLSGFALIGVAGSLDGVFVAAVGHKNIEIRNGTVRNWGGDGVDGNFASSSQLQRLRASDNLGNGLRVGSSSVVSMCTASDNGLDGILTGNDCTVTECTAESNGGDGIDARNSTVSGCSAFSNTADGFVVGAGPITHCAATFNGGSGINALAGSTVTGCVAASNTGDGIVVQQDALVIGNTCRQNGVGAGVGAGIHVTSARNRIEGNNVLINDVGIDVDVSSNLIIKNSASGNTVMNYDIAVGNHYGEILSLPGAGFVNSNPWANFEF